MNKHLIVIGTVVLLLVVGLSGCVDREAETQDETPDNKTSNNLVGLWKRESDNYYEQYYENGTFQPFMEYNNYVGGSYYTYTYNNNTCIQTIYETSIWDIEWLGSNMFNKTLRETGDSYIYNRVASLPT
jgi:hypothetical protein